MPLKLKAFVHFHPEEGPKVKDLKLIARPRV